MDIIFTALIVLFASFIRAISGFGQALIIAPLFTFIMDTKQAVVLSVILGGISSVIVLYYTWRDVDLRKTVFLGIGVILGIPLGAYLLSILSSTIMRLVMASVAIPFAVSLLLGHSHRFSRDSIGCTVAGFFGGILMSATSMGGPPIVLFLLNQGLVKEKFVGTLALIAVLMVVAAFIAHSTLGLVDKDILIQSAILIPALWVGTFIGIKVLPKIEPGFFRKMASGIVLLSATTIIINIVISALKGLAG